MARITTASHPLVSLRVFCGFTRNDISRIAGITSAQVQNIELDRSPMPKQAALLIEAATGCRAESLMDKDSSPLFLTGEPFTKKLWLDFQRRMPAEKEFGWAEEDLTFRLSMMIRASGRGLYGFAHAVGRALEEAAKNAGIAPEAIDAKCRKNATVTMRMEPVKEVRLMMRKVGKSDAEIDDRLKGFKDSSECEVVEEIYRACPGTDADDAQKGKLAGHAKASVFLIAHKKVTTLWRIGLPDGSKIELALTRGGAVSAGHGDGASVRYHDPYSGEIPAVGPVAPVDPIAPHQDNRRVAIEKRKADYQADLAAAMRPVAVKPEKRARRKPVTVPLRKK